MFGKLSRYRRVPDIAVVDARGRVVAAKDFRPLPEVTGTFTHTVDSGDRLDQLAATFYGQPLQYWHVCDANPDFLSPLALLGQEPLVTTRFPVTAAGTSPRGALLAALSATVGVDAVTADDDAVVVTYNRTDLDVTAVIDVIEKAGFTVGLPADSGRLGRQIVIPPAVS
ncbi:hypothetical protein ACGFMK_23950 [Amycolatopsis sp. NPDC049252]|uniref:hypothetical protein n=1 Tax=Amycolatopsis sp. NPDC049252 TaxID=3363933 RepID=UPI003712F0A6